MAEGKVSCIRKDVPESWEEALQQFCYWKQTQGLSERTIIDYRTQVSILFRRYPEAYNAKNLKAAVFDHMAQQVKPATFNIRLVNLRIFLDWSVKEGIFLENPLEGFLNIWSQMPVMQTGVHI